MYLTTHHWITASKILVVSEESTCSVLDCITTLAVLIPKLSSRNLLRCYVILISYQISFGLSYKNRIMKFHRKTIMYTFGCRDRDIGQEGQRAGNSYWSNKFPSLPFSRNLLENKITVSCIIATSSLFVFPNSVFPSKILRSAKSLSRASLLKYSGSSQ